ncbi:aldo/keto reductase family protein [Jeotgalibaca sp. A122]|uniref:aldo/keto reductase family protein n=1 Tax=Jeotgalibaca sp. A122 TaxID=3457322 RepID=UPI003FD51CCC
MSILNETYELEGGVLIPKIALGTWQISTPQAVHPTEFALKNGYIHIDTAHGYANAKGIREGIKASRVKREDIFITSKVRGESKTYNEAMANIHDQLEDLDTDYLDLMLIHCPTPWRFFNHKPTRPHFYKENIEVWRAMSEAKEQGLIRALGVSNFNVDDLEHLIEATGVKPAVNQIRFSIGHTQPEIVAFCQENGILVEAYSSLGTGSLLKNEDIQKIADKYNKTVAQVAYRYPVQKGMVILPKSVHDKYILENADIDFEIEAEDMAFLDSLDL